jgi:hypothetical protein
MSLQGAAGIERLAQRGNPVANASSICIATRLPRRPLSFALAAPRNDIEKSTIPALPSS